MNGSLADSSGVAVGCEAGGGVCAVSMGPSMAFADNDCGVANLLSG